MDAKTAGRQGGCVLVVDDEETQRIVLQRFLRKRGWEVDLASGGEEAVRHVEASPPDVVVMDIRMPGGDGREALTRIARKHPRLPVILMTAYGDIRDAVDSVKSGAVDYLTKPIDLHELGLLLENAVGNGSPRIHDTTHPALPPHVVAESPSIAETLSEVAAEEKLDQDKIISFLPEEYLENRIMDKRDDKEEERLMDLISLLEIPNALFSFRILENYFTTGKQGLVPGEKRFLLVERDQKFRKKPWSRGL